MLKIEYSLCQFFLLTMISSIWFSCNNSTNSNEASIEKVTSDEVAQTTKKDSSIIVSNTIQDKDDNVDFEDCIFDQASQTDEFLKGIKELENYRWFQDTRTAEIVLNDHWSLQITRGGCDHFTFEADFVYDRFLDFEEQKEFVFHKVIWLSNLLEDLDHEVITECFQNNKLSIQIEDNKRHINFLDQRIYESYYMNFYTLDNRSYIHISYFIN